jgi:carbon storage regulator
MFILIRRLDQTVAIGPDIKVTIVGVRGKEVRIGIEAPRAVAVHRAEVVERMKRAGPAPPGRPGRRQGAGRV